MVVEAHQLNGKTIKDCFFIDHNSKLKIEFTDGQKVVVNFLYVEDEITGNDVPLEELIIETTSL